MDIRGIVVCALLLGGAALVGPEPACAAVPQFTLEQVRGYVFHGPPVAAAGAPRIAWVANDRGRDNLWVAEAPGFEPRQLTRYADDDGQEISSLSLSDDGQWLVYVRGGEHGGNWLRSQPANPASLPAGAKVEIWSLPFSGGAPRRLVEADYPQFAPGNRVLYSHGGAVWTLPVDGSAPPEVLFRAAGGAGSLAWSPDGKQLAFVSHRGTHSYVGLYTGAGAPIRWLSPSVARDGDPRWSPDGRRIAFTRRPSELDIPYPGPVRNWDAFSQYFEMEPQPWSIWTVDVDSGEARRWWSSGKALRDSYVGWGGYLDWAADDRIVFKSYHDGWPHLYSLASAGAQPLLLTPGGYSVQEVLPTPDRRGLVFSANTGGDRDDIDRRHLFIVPTDRPGHRQLVEGTGLEWGAVVVQGGHLAFSSATAQRPPLPALMPLAGGAPRLLAQHRDYPTEQLVVPRKVTFEAEDGVTVHGQLFVPTGAEGARNDRPAVVWIHGGPGPQQLLGWHPSSYYSNDYAVNQYLARRGFVVLTVNYRTDANYGHDYNFPPEGGVMGGSEYRDIRAAGRYLQALPQVDPERIGVYGGSYGGYLTAMALAHDSALFKAGVDIHGVHDWIAQYNLRDLFSKLPYDFAGDTRKMLDVVWRASPVSAIDTWKSPVLLISGDDDRNVSFEQTLDLARRLERAGVHYESLVLPDETHSLLRYANTLRMNAATVEFLERHLSKP